MTKWRPEGWEVDTKHVHGQTVGDFFEAGADAMLEAVKRIGTRGHLFDSSILQSDGKIVGLAGYPDNMGIGTFIFIPDDKE